MDIKAKCLELLEKSLYLTPKELNELDWKERLSTNNNKLAHHLSAFANLPGGGYLVYGIRDDGQIVGIESKQVEKIVNTLGNIARDALTPNVNIESITLKYKAKLLLAIYIEESSQKPVYITSGGIENSYKRAGGQTRKMGANEIRAAIITSRTQRYEEYPAILPADKSENWQDLFDFHEILKRTGFFGSVGSELMYEHLYQYKLLTCIKGKYHPTNLCVITCAKDFANLPGYEKFGIRVTQYPGTNKLSSMRDIFFNKGYSLSLDEIVAATKAIIPSSEIIEKATRITTPVIPEIAIRELVVNAAIHRDFSLNDSMITVDIFADRIEVTNPGGLLPDLSVDRLIDHPSKTRNEVLADLMRKLNFAEEQGSGYDKIITAIEIHGLPPISFRAEANYFRAVLYMPKKFKDMQKDERIEAIYQHACLNTVANKKTNNPSIRERFKFANKDSTKVYRIVKEAIDKGRIKCANPESKAKQDWHYIPYWA